MSVKNYKIARNDSKYDIVEVATDQVISTHVEQTDAKKRMKYLNGGGGFNGWTPAFFLKKAEIKLKSV